MTSSSGAGALLQNALLHIWCPHLLFWHGFPGALPSEGSREVLEGGRRGNVPAQEGSWRCDGLLSRRERLWL